jgi:hypothetical protein
VDVSIGDPYVMPLSCGHFESWCSEIPTLRKEVNKI